MKKFLFFASALAGLFLAASCQQESLEPVGGNTVTYTVQVPDALATKALGDDVTNVNVVHYEVYRTAGAETVEFTAADNLLYHKTAQMSNGTATINLELVNDQNYTVLFWAQVQADMTALENEAYVVSDLTNVTIKSALNSNQEAYAAFAGVDFIEAGEPLAGRNVTLVRPISQLNIATTSGSLTAFDDDITLNGSSVTVVGLSNTFDVAKQEPSAAMATTYTYSEQAVPAQTLAVNGENYAYVAMNYVGFAAGIGSNVKVSYVINTSEGDIDNSIENVPVKPNFRTNIVGNLVTATSDYTVTLDKEFNADNYVVEGGKSYHSVSTAEELVNVVAEISQGNTTINNIMLADDIDLSELTLTRATVANWTPIGTPEKPFNGIFNGNGYSIKNLSIVETEGKEGKAYIGFIGYAKGATIKNVTFENVYLNIACLDIDHSQGHIGAVAGSLEGTSTIENVTVKGDIKIESTFDANGASRVAVVAGGNSYGNVTMKNVHVIANDGSYLKANNNVGALAGQLQGISVFENCSSNIDVTGKKFFAGGIIGLAAENQTFINCHTTGDVVVTAGREGRAHDQYRVGGIAGGWADNVKTPCVLENCSYTGTVSGANADGSVADPLDYMGYVGRGYTLAGCAGSTVIVNGVGFVQKYNTVEDAGKYDIFYQVTTLDELQDVLNKEESVAAIFMNDIEGNVTVSQKAGVELIINGNDHSFKGVITVDGKSATYTTAGLTVKNLTFDASTISADACIRLGDGTSDTRYTCNVTVDNCTFDVPGAVGVKSYTGGDKNLTITGCTATANAHSLVQAKGIDGILVEKCVVNSKNGLNFNNSDNVTVNNCTADVKGYAVRFGESSGGVGAAETYAINNSNLKSACEDGDAVIILRGTADNSTLNINNTTLEGTIQITNNATNAKVIVDGGEYVADGLFLSGNTYTVHSGNGFKYAVTKVLNDKTKDVTIELANDIDLNGIEWPAVKTDAAFVLDGKGYSIKNLTTSAVEDHGFYSTAMFTSTRKATTIKNLVVENAIVTGKGGDNSHGAVLVACNYAALNIEGVTVKTSKVSNCDRSSALVTYLYFTTATIKDCVVESCEVNSIGTAGALLGMNNSHDFEATGNTVKNTIISSSEGENKAGILIGTWQTAGTLTESENVVENSKAINAGVETNNNIGREV